MSITDELRAYAHDCCARIDDELHEIADRIDAEHEKAMSRAGQLLADAEKDRDYNYANWQECKQKVLQGNITFDELNAKIGCLEEELSNSIELPKDADGEYIHVGDVLSVYGDRRVCCEMRLGACGHWEVLTPTSRHLPDEHCELHHYHTPTIEDVLREFVSEFNRDDTELCDEEIIERFAAKLQLREDA